MIGYFATLCISVAVLALVWITIQHSFAYLFESEARIQSASVAKLGGIIGQLMCLNTPIFDSAKRDLLWLSILVVTPSALLGAFIGAFVYSTSIVTFYRPFAVAIFYILAHICIVWVVMRKSATDSKRML